MKYYMDRDRHLICMPYSEEGLHAMANRFCIGKHWFHKKPYPLSHYDVPKRRVSELLHHPEITVITSREMVRKLRAWQKGMDELCQEMLWEQLPH